MTWPAWPLTFPLGNGFGSTGVHHPVLCIPPSRSNSEVNDDDLYAYNAYIYIYMPHPSLQERCDSDYLFVFAVEGCSAILFCGKEFGQ